MIYATTIETPLGPIHAQADENAITVLQFDSPTASEENPNTVLKKLRAELSEYFAGRAAVEAFPASCAPPFLDISVGNELPVRF